MPPAKTDTKRLGHVWQPLCKTIWGARLCENIHTHSVILGSFLWVVFICLILSGEISFLYFNNLIQMSCKCLKFVFSTFPYVLWRLNCLFWSFIWNWREETYPTEWSCAGTYRGWQKLKAKNRNTSLSHQMTI